MILLLVEIAVESNSHPK